MAQVQHIKSVSMQVDYAESDRLFSFCSAEEVGIFSILMMLPNNKNYQLSNNKIVRGSDKN